MGSKIKVLHIIKSLGRGGAEMLLPETLKIHSKEKFEFHYIYFLPWKNQVEVEIQKSGGVVTCLPASNNFQIIWKLRAVSEYIQKNEIQIVHCHLPWAGILGRSVYRSMKIPVIYTEHNKQERYHFITRWMNRFTFNWQSVVIAVSRDVALSIKQHISTRIPIYEIANGVNTYTFRRDKLAGQQLRQKLSIPEDACVVGTVAVFRFQKRLKEWLEVFAEASRHNPTMVGIIVGDGPLKQEVEQHRKALGLEDKVILAGLQTDVRPWYNTMDVFMMTSVFEGLPVALLEAMSMECAIVTTDAGGIKEVIRNEIDGIIVPVDKYKALAEKLIVLSEFEKGRLELAAAARKRVHQDFSLTRMVTALEELYVQLIVPR